MSQNIDSNLLNTLIIGSAQKAQAKFAPITDLFSFRPSEAMISSRPKAAIVIEVPNTAACVVCNATDFEAGVNCVIAKTVTLVRRTTNIEFSTEALQRGLDMQATIANGVEAFTKGITDYVLTAFLAGSNEVCRTLACQNSLRAGLPTVGSESFLWVNKQGYKLILPKSTDSTAFAVSDGLAGFDKVRVGSLGTNDASYKAISGVKESMVIATALPIVPAEGMIVPPSVIVLPNGMPALSYVHYSTKTQSFWAHIDLYIGAVVISDLATANSKWV